MMEGFAAALAVIDDDVSPATQTTSYQYSNDTPAPVLLVQTHLSHSLIALLISEKPACTLRLALPGSCDTPQRSPAAEMMN